MFRAASLLWILAACSGGGEPPVSADPAPAPAVHGDGGIDAVASEPVNPAPVPRPVKNRPGRPIEIVLRSSPAHAQVSVDGVPYGETPQVWSGDTGAEHLFTFRLEKHEMVQYRFIPIASGILHAHLDLLADEADAGVAPPPEVVPPRPSAPELVPPSAAIDAPLIDTAPAADATQRGQIVPN